MLTTNTFAVRLPAVSLILCLTAGLLIFTVGNWQARQLAETESDQLGKALTVQSVEGIRQYILHNDRVSMQVYVDHLVKRAAVAGAAIYSDQQRQLVRSGDRSGTLTELNNYREPLVIEGKTAAYVHVDINITTLLARYRKPLNWILAIWAAFTIVIIGIAYLVGHRLSKQLATLSKRLPGEEQLSDCRDELEFLALRLQPLLTQNIDSKSEPNLEHSSTTLQIASMALHCKNLLQLEQQLSKDKFQRLLNKLDDDLDQIAALYDGQRRPGRDQTLFIEFNGDSETGDHPMRALFCAHILLELAECYARSQGVAMELSAAVKLSSEKNSNALLNDFEREKRETEVARLAHQGKRSETLVDSATSLHHTLTDIFTTEEVSESADLHKVASFTSTHQALLEKQLRYLVEHPA